MNARTAGHRDGLALVRGARLLFLAAVVFCLYLGFATKFDWNPWQISSGGFFFNAQARSLLDLRMDVDARVMGMEGFLRDGKTYTYFGILPALFRLPLASELWRDWTTLSCVLASTLAVLALWLATTAALGSESDDSPRALRAMLLVALILSGPQFELLGKPSAYVEAVLWSYAFACGFVALGIRLVLGEEPDRKRLTLLASLAAAALLTRVSTGLALYAAWALLVAAAGLAWPPRAAWVNAGHRLLPAIIVLVAALGTTAATNVLRWGDPLEFAPLATNRYYAAAPRRLARLEQQGVFSISRLPYALSYYLAPGWFFDAPPGGARATRIVSLFDGPEGPPLGFPRSHGLWLTLAATGLGMLASRHIDGPRLRLLTLALASGLVVAPLLVMSYHYLAFRYRAEFVPLLMLFALLGIHGLNRWTIAASKRVRSLVLASCALVWSLQVMYAVEAWRAHGCTPFGSYANARNADEQCLRIGD